MSWLVSKLRGRAEGSSPDVSGHGAQEEDDLLTIRLLHAEDQEEEAHASQCHVRFGDGDEDGDDPLFLSGAEGGSPLAASSSVLAGSGPDQQGLLSTFRSIASAAVSTNGSGGRGNSPSRRTGERHAARPPHERAASASEIAGFASRALHRAVSKEEVETLLGPPTTHHHQAGQPASSRDGLAEDYYSVRGAGVAVLTPRAPLLSETAAWAWLMCRRTSSVARCRARSTRPVAPSTRACV